ncbi:DUF6328 family protein [Actinocatenispora rupis]|uniref:Membrane protein n=1 Tax=Actinocatenispora rupis TaxID=519421 RepID=A0A8J3JBR7_9ACTN|nr:DUF6328 family protein [Actinocatenispora rupis]GID15505.1 membrane protein [Actinocatenispora rupis]
MADGKPESEAERLTRNLHELLQELRVAQTGVQLLFAFLLTLAFTNRFATLGLADRVVYVATLVAASLAAGLLIAPVSYHRMVFRRHLRPRLVLAAHRMAAGGLGFLVAAVVGAVYLVVDVVFSLRVAAPIAAGIAAWFVLFWYVVPLVARGERRTDRSDRP